MSKPIINWLQLSGGKTVKIPTTVTNKPSGSTGGIVLYKSDGLMSPGENDSDAHERTFSSGTVLPPVVRRKGRDITLYLYLYGNVSTVKSVYNSLMSLSGDSSVTLTSDFPHNMTVQVQRVECDWHESEVVKVELYLKASNA